MVQYSPKGTYEEAALYIDTINAAVDKVEARHPGIYVEHVGSVSTEKATRGGVQRAARARSR